MKTPRLLEMMWLAPNSHSWWKEGSQFCRTQLRNAPKTKEGKQWADVRLWVSSLHQGFKYFRLIHLSTNPKHTPSFLSGHFSNVSNSGILRALYPKEQLSSPSVLSSHFNSLIVWHTYIIFCLFMVSRLEWMLCESRGRVCFVHCCIARAWSLAGSSANIFINMNKCRHVGMVPTARALPMNVRMNKCY